MSGLTKYLRFLRIRYSFKVFLVAFTVVSIFLGVFAARLNSARRQKAAVATLRDADCNLWYDYETWEGRLVRYSADPLATTNPFGVGSKTPNVRKWQVWLGRRFGPDFVFDVHAVYSPTALPPKAVSMLHNLRALRHLHIDVGQSFVEDAWRKLCQCHQLEQLNLEREQHNFTRRLAGLAALNGLRSLTIQGGELTREDVREIARLPELRELELSLVGITGNNLQPLAKLENLEVFDLTHRGLGDHIHAADIEFLSRLPNLKSVTLARLPSLDDSVFSQLANIKRLESLNLDQASVTGSNIARLAELPNLTSLNLIGTQIDDAALRVLPKLKRLESLDLSYTKISDDGLKYLLSLSHLRNLNVSGDLISDAGMVHIARLAQLDELMINSTNISDSGLMLLANMPELNALTVSSNGSLTNRGVTALKNALPKCNIR
jgi:Leucine-rich repeat (LRR) protein